MFIVINADWCYMFVLNVYGGRYTKLHLLLVASFHMCHLHWKKEILQINIIGLKIPTDRRQTCCLFTSMTEELNQGLPRTNSSLVVRVWLEPTTKHLTCLIIKQDSSLITQCYPYPRNKVTDTRIIKTDFRKQERSLLYHVCTIQIHIEELLKTLYSLSGRTEGIHLC